MVPPPKGAVFGPIKDWGIGSCKLLLEIGNKEGVKGRRQYVLEEVANWVGILEFGDRGARALDLAMANTERAMEAWQGEGDWCRYISQVERDLREEEEVIKLIILRDSFLISIQCNLEERKKKTYESCLITARKEPLCEVRESRGRLAWVNDTGPHRILRCTGAGIVVRDNYFVSLQVWGRHRQKVEHLGRGG